MAESKTTPRNRKQATRPEPITRHPLFPAIVALWFAALLGVGSLVLSTTLLERLVLTTGLDTMITAAAPPLGIKARLLVALALGLLGAVTGWLLALRVARPAARRAPQVFKVADVDLPEAPRQESRQAPMLDPSSLAAAPTVDEPVFAAEPELIEAEPDHAEMAEPESLAVAEPVAPVIATADAVEVAASAMTIEAEAVVAPRAPLVTAPFFAQAESREPTAAERIAAADLAELSHVELIERLAIALQRREALAETTAASASHAGPVVAFPDFGDRRGQQPRSAASSPRVAPQETEMALRHALDQLQRMSGTRG